VNRTRKIVGWKRAAKKLFAEVTLPTVRVPIVSVEVAAEMEATRRRIALRRQRLTAHSNLTGRESGRLFAWHKSQGGDDPTWWCLCACGRFCQVSAHAFIHGWKKDCGTTLKPGCREEERKRMRAARRKRRWAKLGRKRAPWKRFTGLYA
jgi:hypothetical protein